MMWHDMKEFWRKDPEARPLVYFLGVLVLVMMVIYGVVAYVVVTVAHEVRDQGLWSVVERIWNGPER